MYFFLRLETFYEGLSFKNVLCKKLNLSLVKLCGNTTTKNQNLTFLPQ